MDGRSLRTSRDRAAARFALVPTTCHACAGRRSAFPHLLLLVGKTLVEAIETLLPDRAGNTRIDLGADTGFVMDMARLKMLSGEAASVAGAAEEVAGDPPVVASRADVAGHLRALEEFFRAREPASPVPVLLFRAKTYLEKDFSAVVAELIPAPPVVE